MPFQKSRRKRRRSRERPTQSRRRSTLETLEKRDLLAADYRNPVDAFDVNDDRRISALDALVVINDLGRHGPRTIDPSTAPTSFVDVSGEGDASALDALRVINALGRGVSSPYVLRESDDAATQSSITIGLGEATGIRTYRLQVDAQFDASATTSSLEDTLAIYLTDQDTGKTLLDRGSPGTSLFTLSGEHAQFVPGQVRFDGSVVEIDVTTSPSHQAGNLVLQLINTDHDTGSVVTITPLSNSVDLQANPSATLNSSVVLSDVGSDTDTTTLGSNNAVLPIFDNIRYDAPTDTFAAELRLQNDGDPIGRDAVVVFDDLPSTSFVSPISGSNASNQPFLNFRDAIPAGGLNRGASSDAIEVSIQSSRGMPLSLATSVLVGEPNRPPAFQQIPALTVSPGELLTVELAAGDPDGDPVSFSWTPGDTMPTTTLRGTGELVFAPTPGDIGQYAFDVTATDGQLNSSQLVQVTVAADSVTSTRLSGRVLNTDQEPLAGVPVEVGAAQSTTAADGSFTLTLAGGSPNDTLLIHGEALAGQAVYPFIAEKLGLMLEQGFFPNVNNIITRPIYLPALDVAGGTTIDPTQDMTVAPANLPGAELFVGAGTLRDQQGGLFNGVLSITEVPVDLTPAALPANLQTDLVITIQPGEMVFEIPAPIAFPNRSGLDPGTLTDLYSINPETGQFDLVGTGQVSTDGSVIETISGGVRNSSWHFSAEREKDPEDPKRDPRKQDDGCDDCEDRVVAASEVALHSGVLTESHALARHQSLGQQRGLTLVYDSQRADPRPILPFGFDNVAFAPQDRLVARVQIHRGSTKFQLPGVATGVLSGMQGGENFWQLPTDGGSITASLQVDMAQFPSGQYHYDQATGILRLGDDALNGSLTNASADFIHVNSIESLFGAGWGLTGLTQIIANPDGSLLLIDGDGGELLFDSPTTSGDPHVSPAGDFSSLQQEPDGSYRRVFPDQMVEIYNSAGYLESMTDRNSNSAVYAYDAADRLTTITDPAGLVTTFTYTNSRVTSITDPANRVTQLEYDAVGNLTRITDPDDTSRDFDYDGRHHLISEIDKRGFREEVSYGFHGRVERVLRGDGSQQLFNPLQTQGLFAPNTTTDPFDPPTAIVDQGPTATLSDPNGDVSTRRLDRAGQLVNQNDAIGAGPLIFRDIDNLVRSVTDARGNTTFFDYDDSGNRTAIVDSIDEAKTVSGQIASAGEVDVFEFTLTEATGFYVDTISAGTTNPQLVNLELQQQFGSQWLFANEANLDRVDSNGVTDDDVVTFLAAGTYRILVSGVDDHTGDYMFRPQSISAGIPISLEQAIVGVTEFPSASALFTLDGMQGEQWFITSQQSTTPSGAFIRLIDPTGRVLDRFVLNGSSGPITLPSDGTYTILVEGDLGTSAEGNYAFTVRGIESEVLPAAIDQPIRGNLSDSGQVDRYWIVVADETLVRLDARQTEAVITLQMSGPAGEIIPQTNLTAIENSNVSIDNALLLEPGTYELLIESVEGAGSYEVLLVDLFQSKVITFDQRVSAGGLDARIADAYRIETMAGDQLRIELLNRATTDPANTQVVVFDRYGTRLLDQSLANLISDFAPSIDGPLFVYFDAPVTSTKSDFFAFSVMRLGEVPPTPPGGVPLTFNQQIESSVESGSPATYEFTLNERTLLRLDPRTSDSSLRISLTGDAGTFLDHARFDFNQANRWLNLPAGHHHIEIETTAGPTAFAFAVLLADQNVAEIGDQLGSQIDLSLGSESTQLQRVTLAQETSLFGEFLSFGSGGSWSLANASGQVMATANLDRDLNIGRLDPGTYFLALDHLTTTASTVPLSFMLREQTSEQFEIALGDPIAGILEDPGDRDLYHFTLDDPTIVHLTCQSPNSTVRFSIDGPAGTLFENAPMSACAKDRTDISDLSFQAPPGEYFVTLDSVTVGNVTANISYDLQLRDMATATVNADGKLTGTLDPFTSELFAVEFASKSEIKIDANNNDFDLVVELINADGSDFNPTLRFRNNTSIPISDPSITVQGSYYIVVHNRSADVENYSYTINVLGTLPDDPEVEGVIPLRIAKHLGTRIEYDPTFSLPTQITTSEGRTTEFELDPTSGNVLKATRLSDDGNDSVDSYTYNSAGQPLTQTDGEGRVVLYGYDLLGRLDTITEAPGTPIEAVTRFEFDDAGNATTIHTPRGSRIDLQFDELNRLTHTEGPDPDSAGPLAAPVSETEYDPSGNTILVRDPLNRETQLIYDARNRLLRIDDALDQPTQFVYDSAGNNTEVIDARGNSTRSEYDLRGRVTDVVDAQGNRTTFTYDLDDNLTQTTSPLDEVTQLEYDARSRITAVIDPLGNRGQRFYDGDNFLIEQMDANQNPLLSLYDALGRVTSIVDALGNETTFEYDRSSLRVATVNPLGQRTEREYDDRGRVVLTRDPIGEEIRTGYDLASNVTSTTDELGNGTTFTYDLLNRLTERVDPDPDGAGQLEAPVTTFSYDIADNLLSRTDAAQNVTSYQYDDLNRVIIETDPRSEIRSFTYDPVGNLSSRADRNGRVTTYDYDSLNRHVTESWLDQNSQPIDVFDYSYDAVGRLLSANDANTSVTSSFDDAGRVTQVTQSTTGAPAVMLDYSHDAVGNRTQTTETIDGAAAGQTNYLYDALNRNTRIEQSAQAGAVDPVSAKRIDLFYSAIGQFDQITRYADLAGQSQATDSRYTYDGRSRLESLTHRDATDAVIADYGYQYDARSLITQITDVDGTTDYTYDNLSRLITGDNTDDSRDQSYGFDAAGNRTSSHLHDSDYVTETGNRLTGDGTYTYQYDAEGNLILRTDNSSGEVRELAYDHRNRLTRVTDRASASGVIMAETTYRYDAFNRRVAKLHDVDGEDSQLASAEYYFHDGNQVVLEFADSDGPIGAASPVLSARNLYGPRIDFLLAVEQPQQGRLLWILADHSNTTRDVVNSDGTQHNHLVYDAYGNLLSATTPDLTTRFLYTGREFDSDTDLYYYRERYYDSTLGRFITEDPIGFAGGSNLFAFATGNPVSSSDPPEQTSERFTNEDIGLLAFLGILDLNLDVADSNEVAIIAGTNPAVGSIQPLKGSSDLSALRRNELLLSVAELRPRIADLEKDLTLVDRRTFDRSPVGANGQVDFQALTQKNDNDRFNQGLAILRDLTKFFPVPIKPFIDLRLCQLRTAERDSLEAQLRKARRELDDAESLIKGTRDSAVDDSEGVVVLA